MDDLEHFNKTRSYIHDIANKLTIAYGSVNKVRKLINKREDTEAFEEELNRLNKAYENIEMMIKLVKDLRTHVYLKSPDDDLKP